MDNSIMLRVSAWTGCALRLCGTADWALGRLLSAREVTFRFPHDPQIPILGVVTNPTHPGLTPMESGVYRRPVEVVKDRCYVGRVSWVGDDTGIVSFYVSNIYATNRGYLSYSSCLDSIGKITLLQYHLISQMQITTDSLLVINLSTSPTINLQIALGVMANI